MTLQEGVFGVMRTRRGEHLRVILVGWQLARLLPDIKMTHSGAASPLQPSDTVELQDLALISNSGGMPVVRIRSQEDVLLEDKAPGETSPAPNRRC